MEVGSGGGNEGRTRRGVHRDGRKVRGTSQGATGPGWNLYPLYRYSSPMSLPLTESTFLEIVGSGSQATVQDTVVMVAARDGHDLVLALAAGSVAATFFAVLLGLAFLFIQARLAIRKVEEMRVSLIEDPGVASLRSTAAHVEAVAESLRNEITRLGSSLGQVSDRVEQASERMEERIEEFNALMGVIQEEAEGVFMDTAATARGIREGVRSGSAPGRGGGSMDRDSEQSPAQPGPPPPTPPPPGPPPPAPGVVPPPGRPPSRP